MKLNLIFVIAFFDSIFFSISFVQKQNFFNNAIDLLSSESLTRNITVYDGSTANFHVKFYKYIGKENGAVVYKKYIIVYKNNNFLDQKVVDFDIIESFHEFEEDIFVCPKGKYSPLTIKFREFKRNYNNILDKIEDWELKCIDYNQKYFMIFYLTKEKYHIFNKKSGTEWQYTEINQEINAIQLLNNRISNNDYPTIYIIKDSGALKIKVVSHKIAGNSDTNFLSEFDSCIAKHITNAGNNTRICFENNNELFYFLTYTNASDFSCGYFDYNENIDFTAFEGNLVNINTESPLEFFDETKIEYIKFIYNYKYAYYKINNLNNGKNFYGIIDTKKNLVVFNTEEDIITYVPYSNISMLAITSTTAYEN